MTTARPFFFGTPDARLFGWLHPVAGDVRPDLGLVICSPFGFEAVCAHRSLRHLAQAAAAAGFPSLRFDYAGCGDSAGDANDPDTIGQWVYSIHCAVDALKAQSNVSRVCLLGLRLGGALATLAATARPDVDHLIVIAPVVQGRAYLRELKAFAASSPVAGPPPVEKFSGLEAGGFFLTDEAVGALAAIDSHALAASPASQVLIVERDDMPTSQSWTNALVARGAVVTSEAWSGYRLMMQDPQRSEVPREIIAGTINTLSRWAQALPMKAASSEEADESVLPAVTMQGPGYIEQTVLLNTESSKIFGILSMAPSAPMGDHHPADKQVACLLINSGAVHHIGPSRLWVQLARRWAAQGITVLRLDLSGLGDSPARPQAQENVVYSVDAARDIAAALCYLKDVLGIHDCRLVGLCSGAFHGFKAAVAGQRFSSVVMINPLTFFWELGKPVDEAIKDYEVAALSSDYRQKLFSLAAWRKLIRGEIDFKFALRFLGRKTMTLIHPWVDAAARIARIPKKDYLARELQMAVAHGSMLKFVFSVGEPGDALLHKQGKPSLQPLMRQGGLSIDYIEAADHTFTRHEARERLILVLDELIFCNRGSICLR